MQQLEQLIKQNNVDHSALNNAISAVLADNKVSVNELLTAFIGEQNTQKFLVEQIYGSFDVYQRLDFQ